MQWVLKTEFLRRVSDTTKVNPDLGSMKVRHWKLDSLEHGLKGTSGSLALLQTVKWLKLVYSPYKWEKFSFPNLAPETFSHFPLPSRIVQGFNSVLLLRAWKNIKLMYPGAVVSTLAAHQPWTALGSIVVRAPQLETQLSWSWTGPR